MSCEAREKKYREAVEEFLSPNFLDSPSKDKPVISVVPVPKEIQAAKLRWRQPLKSHSPPPNPLKLPKVQDYSQCLNEVLRIPNTPEGRVHEEVSMKYLSTPELSLFSSDTTPLKRVKRERDSSELGISEITFSGLNLSDNGAIRPGNSKVTLPKAGNLDNDKILDDTTPQLLCPEKLQSKRSPVIDRNFKLERTISILPNHSYGEISFESHISFRNRIESTPRKVPKLPTSSFLDRGVPSEPYSTRTKSCSVPSKTKKIRRNSSDYKAAPAALEQASSPHTSKPKKGRSRGRGVAWPKSSLAQKIRRLQEDAYTTTPPKPSRLPSSLSSGSPSLTSTPQVPMPPSSTSSHTNKPLLLRSHSSTTSHPFRRMVPKSTNTIRPLPDPPNFSPPPPSTTLDLPRLPIFEFSNWVMKGPRQ